MSNSLRKSWNGQTPLFRFSVAILVVVALGGIALIGNGLYIKAKAELSQVLLERAFETKKAGSIARPWPWADFEVSSRISVPRLGISTVVLEGASGQILAFGPGQLNNTPHPGQAGTAVIAAHRDTHFSWLRSIVPGDLLVIENADGQKLTFRAGNGYVARWDESGINADALGKQLALVTCWPFDATEHGPMRYILNAELVDEAPLAYASN